MPAIYIKEYKSPFGELIIGDYEGSLCLLDWKFRKQRLQIDKRIQTALQATLEIQTTTLHQVVTQQLNEYFAKERTSFNIPLLLKGTNFQQEVWQALINIPYGATLSYLDLSKQLGNPKAIRAVATANGANAISIIIPCHRIIGSNGSLIGYAGGLHAKNQLLLLEQSSQQMQLF